VRHSSKRVAASFSQFVGQRVVSRNAMTYANSRFPRSVLIIKWVDAWEGRHVCSRESIRERKRISRWKYRKTFYNRHKQRTRVRATLDYVLVLLTSAHTYTYKLKADPCRVILRDGCTVNFCISLLIQQASQTRRYFRRVKFSNKRSTKFRTSAFLSSFYNWRKKVAK